MNARKFVLAPDNHGDLEDPESIAALLKFVERFKPEIRIHLGDCWDFRNLRKGACEDEQAGSLEDDFRIGLDFFQRFFAGGETRVFLRGNHDQRAWDLCHTTKGITRDYCKHLVDRIETACRLSGVEMRPYDSDYGLFELGELRCIHGYHHGVGACRSHANIYRNCFFGHVHSIESAPVPSHKPAEARSIGCLCKRDIDYINRKTAKLRWGNGWVYGFLFDDGTYQYFQTRKLNGKFYVATEFSEL